MAWYNVLAAPFAGLYGLASLIRNELFAVGVLPSHTVSIPTVCVGNLAVGGTGKTPFVEYLVRMLQKDYHVAVLSRGYRRRTRGFVLADEHATSLTIGDEPLQIHRKFPDVPVAVCKDRVHGIHRLQALYPDLQVVILDDAYQYRRLRCGFYILLTAFDRLYIDDYFLPMGRLRDNRQESLRASAVVVTKCPENMTPIDRRIVDTKLHLPVFQQLCFAHIQYPVLPAKNRALLLTGIAHPEHLLAYVEQKCAHVQLLSYPDHHNFSARDVQQIAAKAQKADIVFTTEKDYVRLVSMALPKDLNKKLYPVPIAISVSGSDDLERQIRQYINENIHTKK